MSDSDKPLRIICQFITFGGQLEALDFARLNL